VPEVELKEFQVPTEFSRGETVDVHRFHSPPRQYRSPVIFPGGEGLDSYGTKMLRRPARPLHAGSAFPVCKTILGPDLEHVALIAGILKFVDPPFTPPEIEEAAIALQYPGPYDQAREAYAAMVQVYEIPMARGDWGGCWADDVQRPRPRLKIPERFRKDSPGQHA
jgi:hypothetical protein